MGYQTQVEFQTWDDGDDGVSMKGWGNNVNESPKWNSLLIDCLFLAPKIILNYRFKSNIKV